MPGALGEERRSVMSQQICELDTKALDKLITKYRGKPGELLGLLEETQSSNPYNYLTTAALEYVAQKTGAPLSRIYSIVTFYSFFNLKPQGEHYICICRGTACHTRRSKHLLDFLRKYLELGEAQGSGESEKVFLTSKDNKFTVKTVACLGQCALAPVVEIDGKIYSRVTEEMLRRIVDDIRQGKKA